MHLFERKGILIFFCFVLMLSASCRRVHSRHVLLKNADVTVRFFWPDLPNLVDLDHPIQVCLLTPQQSEALWKDLHSDYFFIDDYTSSESLERTVFFAMVDYSINGKHYITLDIFMDGTVTNVASMLGWRADSMPRYRDRLLKIQMNCHPDSNSGSN